MSVALDLFSPPRMVAERRGDGVLVLRSADPLGGHASSMPTRSAPAPWHIPGRVPAAQRAGDEWISISWGAAGERASIARVRTRSG
ncbi:MAG TPA: hypothetical protein VI011_18695 [Asanoa sp.]